MKSHKFWIISIVESSKIKIELNVFFFSSFCAELPISYLFTFFLQTIIELNS